MERIDSFIGDEEELKSPEFVSEEQKNKELKKKMKFVILGVFVVMILFLAFTIHNYFFNVHPYDKQPLIYLKNNDMFMKNSDKMSIQFTHNANINNLYNYNESNGTSVASGENKIVYRSESKHDLWFILDGALYMKANFLIPILIDENVKSFIINKEGNRVLYVKNINDTLPLYSYKYGTKPEQICENLYFNNSEKSIYMDQNSNAYGFTEDDNNFYYYKKDADVTKLFCGSNAKNMVEVAQGNNIFNTIISNKKILFNNEQGLFYKNGSGERLKIDSDKTQLLFADNNFDYYYLKQIGNGLVNSLFYAKTSNSTKVSDGIKNVLEYNPKLSVISYSKDSVDGKKDAIYIKRADQKDEIFVAESSIGVIDRSHSIIDFDIISDIKNFNEFDKLYLDVQFGNDFNTCLYLDEVKFKSNTNQDGPLIDKTIDSGTLFFKQLNSGNYGNSVRIDDNILDFKLSSDGKRVVYLKKVVDVEARDIISLFYRDISGTENIEVIKNIATVTSIKCGRDLEGITYLDTSGKLYLSNKGTSPKLLQSNVKTYNINNIGTIDIISNIDNGIYICDYNKTPTKVDDGVSQIIFY
jgi:hypothetical protein